MDRRMIFMALACAATTALAANTASPTFLWLASTDTIGRVETGSPDSTSGWWFDYTDAADSGNSTITFPSDIKPNAYGNFYGPLIENYNGIQASVKMGDGYEFPYAGIGFNVWNEQKEGADISAWGGFCLEYQSTIGFSIELVPENEEDVTAFNNYKATVAKAASMNTTNFRWDKFRQETGWGKEANLDSVLAKTASVKLAFNERAGTEGDFLIYMVGSFGMCSCCGPMPDRIGSDPTTIPVKATLSGRILQLTGAAALGKATVVDLQGNVVMSAPATGIMNLSALRAGMYMLRIEGPGVNHTQKILLK
ncbi:MAG: T9SS type A sorting domain-containing protein [Fibrobacter sp.]|uniref:T9SS type A sorting domain-containing protein n=1 Tax=Fibrobacter sp. UWR3 TaxID=1896217 RepID=UPI00091A7681|nr:T9SS type A sorting domain-containing protein [Fibrobacter sp. UWR3]MBO6136879.1 T9SS type A sorting domain-containing protein [Fibrobacter sp.]SHM90310.1 Por secretion system C-terminal sorting domain-containing protein [Fibrobacter sp. UWR3]